jgi:hypothetical protein
MKNLLLAATFAAGAMAPAMAQEFTPETIQSTTHMQTILTPGWQFSSGGSGQVSGGWLPGEPASTATFNTETSDPNFLERSHGQPQGTRLIRARRR